VSLASLVDGLMGWQWKTIGHHRCLLSNGGNIIKGPREWEGVHVSRLSEFLPRWRELHEADCGKAETGPATYSHKAIAAAAVLSANPELWQRIHEDGAVGSAYRRWLDGGRKGKKPQIHKEDGRFDPINEEHGLKGSRRVCCWLEALYYCLPQSRQWDDIDLRPLEEAHGKPLNLPEQSERRAVAGKTHSECQQAIDAKIDQLRATHGEPLEKAPF